MCFVINVLSTAFMDPLMYCLMKSNVSSRNTSKNTHYLTDHLLI